MNKRNANFLLHIFFCFCRINTSMYSPFDLHFFLQLPRLHHIYLLVHCGIIPNPVLPGVHVTCTWPSVTWSACYMYLAQCYLERMLHVPGPVLPGVHVTHTWSQSVPDHWILCHLSCYITVSTDKTISSCNSQTRI